MALLLTSTPQSPDGDSSPAGEPFDTENGQEQGELRTAVSKAA